MASLDALSPFIGARSRIFDHRERTGRHTAERQTSQKRRSIENPAGKWETENRSIGDGRINRCRNLPWTWATRRRPDSPPTHPSRNMPWSEERGKRRKILKIIAGAVLVLLVAGGIAGYFYWQNLKKTPQYSLALTGGCGAARRSENDRRGGRYQRRGR